MDTSKIRNDLGYRDVNPVEEALGLTVDWLLNNQPEPRGEIEQRLQDRFDYVGEDRVIKTWKKTIEQLAEVSFEVPDGRHPSVRTPEKAR